MSEGIIAEALYPYPEGVVVARKRGFERPSPDQWVENGRPEHLKSACEGSLRRLRLDRIGLYQLHRIDPKVPVENQLGALKDLQAEGKIKHIGLSEVSVRQLQHARTIVRSKPSKLEQILVVDNHAPLVVDQFSRSRHACLKEDLLTIWYNRQGQFYHYFKNKDDLVHEVLQTYLEAIRNGGGPLSYVPC